MTGGPSECNAACTVMRATPSRQTPGGQILGSTTGVVIGSGTFVNYRWHDSPYGPVRSAGWVRHPWSPVPRAHSEGSARPGERAKPCLKDASRNVGGDDPDEVEVGLSDKIPILFDA